MRTGHSNFCLIAALAMAVPVGARGDVTLAPVFGDHAVLQRGKPVPVWGTAAAGESVTVSFHGQSISAKAGPDGRWSANLAALDASSDPADLVVSGSSTITLHDIVVGEVWLCSGQSNMEFTVDDGGGYRVERPEIETANAKYPLIRQLRIERTVATSPATTVKTSGWIAASPETAGGFTAVGYFFARDIYRALGVPIGIIDSPWGGTPIESWMSDAARASTSIAATLEQRWKASMAEWPPQRVAQYAKDSAAWDKAVEEEQLHHIKNRLSWPVPPATRDSPMLPGGLYNAMISPLEPCSIRGILWYQGESNTAHPDEYGELFSAMIRSWRKAFGQGNLPFYFVQIANFGNEYEFADRGWARLREGQQQALSLPATGMAVTVDIGEARNIHPRNKQEVGRRLALLARTRVYSIPPDLTGPVFRSAEREANAMRVRFNYTGDEITSRDGPVRSAEVAGADKVFHPAYAQVDVDSLLVSSPDVPEPVAVRYAWTNAPTANLFGDDGLPVPPFRSDRW
jgi:sialate O-acetylesterase